MARVLAPDKQPPSTPRDNFGAKVKAHVRYKTSAGKPAPGVTTVLGVLNKPALLAWSNRLGLEGIQLNKYVDEAASIGTLAHAIIAETLGGEGVPYDDFTAAQLARASSGVEAFNRWRSAHSLEPILVEAQLVSDEWEFGGTIDCIASLDGVLTLLDFKTSSGIFEEHVFQASAYWKLASEAGHPVRGVRILRIGRTEGEGTEERVLTGRQVVHGWDIFQHCLALWHLKKKGIA